MRESRSRAIGSSRASVFSGARRKVHPEAPGSCQMMPIASYRIRPAIGMGSILYFYTAKTTVHPGRWQSGCLSGASRRIDRTISGGWQEGKLLVGLCTGWHVSMQKASTTSFSTTLIFVNDVDGVLLPKPDMDFL